MKRPSGTVIAVVGAIVALIVIEVIVWWPDPPKKKSDEPPSEPLPAAVKTVEQAPPPPAPAPTPSAAPVRSGRDIQQLKTSERDELRRLEGCSDKKCGDPCVYRCEPGSDPRCVDGLRPGACAADGQCNYMLPAICPQGDADEIPP
jgi:hypothetical protein